MLHSYLTQIRMNLLLTLRNRMALFFSFVFPLIFFFALFFLYGVYSSATEGISKAWISYISDKKDVATAIGTFSAFQSICSLLASSITGIVWYSFGSAAAFITTASVTVGVMLYFMSIPKPKSKAE